MLLYYIAMSVGDSYGTSNTLNFLNTSLREAIFQGFSWK